MIHLRRHRRSAYTLIEMTVSLGVMSVLMGGVGSAMVLASRAMPGSNNPQAAKLASYQVVDQLANELIEMRTLTEDTATSITFTVADRNTDGIPETIRYAWSGTPGDALTRQYNATPAVAVAKNVYGFDLQYATDTTTGSPNKLACVQIGLRIGPYQTTNSVTKIPTPNLPVLATP